MTELEKSVMSSRRMPWRRTAAASLWTSGSVGFVPLSQLASVGNLGANERSGVPDALRGYVGKRLPLKVIEADQRHDRLILSEKAAAQEQRRRRKEEASSQLVEGQVLDGTVASVTTFGIFVDVGAADGLVLRSEITWDKGMEPTTLHRPGDTVRVLVTGVDRDRGRISLSIERLEEDPWARAVRELAIGSDLDACDTRDAVRGLRSRDDRQRRPYPHQRDRSTTDRVPIRGSPPR